MLWLILALVLQVPSTPGQRPAMNAMPPSTLDDPLYVAVPVTIEISNMTAQTVRDLVAAGKIAVDGAHHLNIPASVAPTGLGPDMLRPGSRTLNRPKSSADEPLRQPAGQPLVVAAPEKFTLVSNGKIHLAVQGNRLVLTEIK